MTTHVDIWMELESAVSDYSFKRSQEHLKQMSPDKSWITDKVSKILKISRETWRDNVVDYAVSAAIFATMPIPKKLEAEIILASKAAALYGRFLETHEDAFLSEEVKEEILAQAQIIKVPAAFIAGLFNGASGLVKLGLDKIGMTQDNIERACAKSLETFGKLTPEAQEEAIWAELLPKAAKAAAGGGAEKPKALDKEKVSKEVASFMSHEKEDLSEIEGSIPEEVLLEIRNLRDFLDDQKTARSFSNFAMGFSHMHDVGTRLHMPFFTQVAVFGSRAFSLMSSMREVSGMYAAGSLMSLQGASSMFSVSMAAASLMSMFMQEDETSGLEEMLNIIMPALASISQQLGELKMQLTAFQAETRFEFQRASFELNLVHDSLSRLSKMNLHELSNLRKALDIGFSDVISKIQETAAETHYRLEELQFEPLREAVDVIEFADTRSADLATLKKSGALIERWLASPPCAEIVNGFYLTKKAFDLNSFLKLSVASTTGAMALFAKENTIEGLESFDPAALINPEFFATLVPTYMKYLKALKTRGEVYDLDGALLESKLLSPLKAALAHHEVLRSNRNVFEKLFTKLNVLQLEEEALVRAVSEEKARELASPSHAEILESNARALVSMQKPLWEFTRHFPYHGGWGILPDPTPHSPFWVNKDIGRLAKLLEERRGGVLEKASQVELQPAVLTARFDERMDAMTLRGRLAEVHIHDARVYLYPTFLPLEDVAVTPELKQALFAESLGLGKLEVKATVMQKVMRNHGLYFVNGSPYYSASEEEEMRECNYIHDPLSPKELPIHLEYSFVYSASGHKKLILTDSYNLQPGSDPFIAYQCMSGGKESEVEDGIGASWNGDALSLTLSSRFEHNRKLVSREVNSSNFAELAAKVPARYEALRSDLFQETSGNPVLKKRLKETRQKIEREVAQIYGFAQYLWGIKIEEADIQRLLKEPVLKHDESLLTPIMEFSEFRDKYLARAEINDPIFKLLKDLDARVRLGYQEVLAIPRPMASPAQVLEASALAARVRDLTSEVAALKEGVREITLLREENRELKAMMAVMMKQMELLTKTFSGK